MKNKYLQNERLSIALFLSVFLVYALVYMTKNCYSAAMVLLVKDGILTKSQTGTISAAFYLIYAPFQIVGGIAADKYCPHKLITIGLIGAALANAVVSVTDNYYVMLIAWSINAAAQFGIWPSVFKLVSSAVSPEHRVSSMFYIVFSSPIGTVLSYIVAAFATDWRSNFRISTIILIICIVGWLLSGRYFSKNMVENKIVEVKEASEKGNNSGFIKLLFTSGFVLLIVVVALKTIFDIGLQSVTPTMIFESYDNVSTSLASILNIIPITIGSAGRFIVKAFYRRKKYNEATVSAVMFAIMMPFIIGMLFIGKISVLTVIVLVSVIYMVASMLSTVSATYVAARFSSTGKIATISGLINAMCSFGVVLSNYIIPRLADNFGWQTVIISWIAFAGSALLISIAAIIPWKKFISKA